MKKIIYIVLLISLSSIGLSQSDPDTFDKNDIIEKVDRSELESSDEENSPDTNNIIPKFEMPEIEFDTGIIVEKKSEKSVTKNTQKENKKGTKTTAVKKSNAKKPKVVFARRPISISQIKKNDKILVKDGKTFIYRLVKANIIRYKYFGKLPLDSSGLKASGRNGYYVIDKVTFAKDATALKEKLKKKIPNRVASKPKQKTKNISANVSTSKPEIKNTNTEKIISKPETTIVSGDVESKRKIIEKRLNNGRTIKNNMLLSNLKVNDEVYFINSIQLVIRKKKSTSGTKKYWLIEKLDTNNRYVEKVANNRYKILAHYKAD